MTRGAPLPVIDVLPGGPYRVTGAVRLTQRWATRSRFEEAIDWEPVFGAEVDLEIGEPLDLCRCGRSETRPRCDGTCERSGFTGELTAGREPSAARRRTYHGEGVLVTDDRSLCIHAEFCTNRFGSVWTMVHETADPEVRAKLRRMVSMCPSGRLEQASDEGSEPFEPEFDPSIAVVPAGPLWVRGGIPVRAPDGFAYEVRNRMTLCRCGQSSNKPFCDGTHAEVGFEAAP
jgi:CDGSH-type Zn-finger protein